VPLDGVRFGGRIALALAGDHVQELRALQLLAVARCDQRFDVVAVDGPDVVEAHFLEQVPGSTMPFRCSSERRASSHTVGICRSTFLPPSRRCEYMRPDSARAR
jgi:hypothetical protein